MKTTYLQNAPLAILLFFLNCLLDEVYSQQTTDYLYNPLSLESIGVSQYGKNLIQIQFIQLNPDLLFLSFEDDGLWILDFQNDYQIVASYQMKLQMLQLIDYYVFALTSDQGILLMLYDEKTKQINVKGSYNPTNFNIRTFTISQDQKYMIIGLDCVMKVMKIHLEFTEGEYNTSNNNFLEEKATAGNSCLSNSNHVFMNNQTAILSTIRDGVQLFNINNIESPTYVRSLTKISQDVQQTYLLKYKSILITLSKYYDINIIKLGDNFGNPNYDFSNVDETTLEYLQLTQTGGSMTYNYMLIDDEEQYLYLGVRTNGIVVYDLNPLYSYSTIRMPQLVQSLNSFGLSIWISFAPPKFPLRQKYQYLFLSDGTSFSLFEMVPANLNQNIINLYNPDLCILNNYTSDPWPWSVVTYGDDNVYAAISSGMKGMYTFDLSLRGQIQILQSEIKRYSTESHDGILYLQKRKVIVLGQSGQGMAFYNATDPTNLVYINEFRLQNKQNDCDDITTENQERFLACANGYQGFYILQVDDFMNPTVWAECDLVLKKNGVESVIIDNSLTYGFYAVREEGVGSFKVSKNSNGQNEVTVIKFFPTLGAEYLRFHIASKQSLVLVADGYQGLTIIDCSDFLHPFITKQIPVQGWAVKFTQLEANPGTVIVTQMEKGEISILDITTIQTATKISSFQYGSESAFGIASNPNNLFVVFSLPQGMRVCTTVNPLRIHTQIKRNANSLLSNYLPYIPHFSFSSQEKLYIGEQVDLIFTPYYNARKIKFDKVSYYQNYQLNTLPPWISFVKYLSTITLIPNLDSINTNHGFNILLIQVLIPILPTDFIMRTSTNPPYTYLLVASQSQRIFQQLIQVGILEEDGYLSSFFQSNMKLELDWYKDDTERQQYEQYNDLILTNVKRILTRASFNYPIQFLVEGSLKFNNNLNYSLQSQSTTLIQSFSSNVNVFLIIIGKPEIQFVRQKFDGTVFAYYQQNQIFSISGDIKLVNTYLLSKIIIYDPTQQDQNLTNIQISVNITDSINNPYISSQDVSQLGFISNKQAIQLSSTFQQQYSKQYPNGLTAEERFIIIFDKSLISVQTDLTPIIQVKAKSQEEWKDINLLNFWITYEDYQLKGFVPLSAFNNDYYLQVIITDGYSYFTSNLLIQVKIFPTEQILKLVVIVFSPLIVIIGLFFLRKRIHLILLQNYHEFSEEIIYCNDVFTRKIVFAPNVYQQSLLLFNSLYKSLCKHNQDVGDDSDEKKIQSFISNYLYSDQSINYEEFYKDAYQIYLSDTKLFKDISESEFKHSDTRLKIALKSLLIKFILRSNQQMYKIYKRLKQYSIRTQQGKFVDWYKDYVFEIGGYQQLQYRNQSITTSNQQNSLNESEYRVAFGQLEIRNAELQHAIEQILDQNELSIDLDFSIITEAIKADFYGFDSEVKPRNWRCSIGEVVHTKISDSDPFVVYRKVELEGDKNSLMNKLKQFFMVNYKWVGSYKRNLPDWLGYEMFENVLLLTGIPKKQHSGQYKLIIYNSSGYAAQSINFTIKQHSKKQSNNFDKLSTPKQGHQFYGPNTSINEQNGSMNLNNECPNNYSATEKLVTINLQSPIFKNNSSTSIQRLNTKTFINKITATEENLKDQKKSYFAPSLKVINFSNNNNIQEGLNKQFPSLNQQYQEDESIQSIRSNQIRESGQDEMKINQIIPSSSRKKPAEKFQTITTLMSPPVSSGYMDNMNMFNSIHHLKEKEGSESNKQFIPALNKVNKNQF